MLSRWPCAQLSTSIGPSGRLARIAACAGLALILGTSCGGRHKQSPKRRLSARERALPPRTAPPSCVNGALVTASQVCGLGIAGRAYFWDDENMRNLARRRAARNLAGMIRTMITSAMQIQETHRDIAVRWEKYLEVDESLIDEIEQSADHELWFDVIGEGPFRDPERTYDCACMSAVKAGIKIDPTQAAKQSIGRQYSVDEVPKWVNDPKRHNTSLSCALGYHERMYHPEEMYEPLTDSVRIQLMQETKTWILSQFSAETICGGRSGTDCQTAIDSVVEAANEGVSRGVLLTAVWLDTKGIGPRRTKKTAYGWGCVFDRVVLDKARARIAELRAER